MSELRHPTPGIPALLATLAVLAGGSPAAVWTATGLDLLRAETIPGLSNVLLDHDGTIRLSAGHEVRAEFEDNAVWTIAAGPGDRLHAGTGSDGRLHTLGPGRAAPATVTVEAGDILAALHDPRAGLLFGLTPGGTVSRLGPGGTPEPAFASGEDYVFDLLAGPDGEIYCATGSAGRLYRFRPGGAHRLIFTAPQAHITSLAWLDPGRVLLAGTSPDGLVYRLDLAAGASPDVTVVYDTPFEEIRALAVGRDDDGPRIYIAANGAPAGPDPGRRWTGDDGQAAGAVLRVRENGIRDWEWAVPDSAVYAIILHEDGVLAATGRSGLIYRLDRLGRPAIFARLPAARVLCLTATPGGIAAGTSEPASVIRLPAGFAGAGWAESPVHDCDGPAGFGRIEHRASLPSGTTLALDTRTGNSAKPDSTWSEWRETDGTVRSRPARFIQWRARLGSSFPGRTPVLERVAIHYRVPNRPPRVSGPELSEPGAAEAARGAARPVRELTWTAQDPDSDSLAYALGYQPDGHPGWLLLADAIAEPRYEFDTRLLPDGWYRFRVTATDAPARPRAEALSYEAVSPPVLLDNTPPRVAPPRLDGDRLAFTVTDALSTVSAARVAVNAGPWQPVAPLDGLFDRPEESFAVDLALRPGANHIAIWAADARGNVSGTAITVSR
jgi:hypothetical protein